ncbi:MAG: hypothetical protein RIA62_18365 [Cyclobacteriaceae bacterium]
MSKEENMRFGRSMKVLRFFLIGIGILLGSGAVAQNYYVAKEGKLSIHFGYKDGISIANSEKVDIIFNREKIIMWITVKGSDLTTGKRKVDKRLFRKNESEFVIKIDLMQENIISGKDDLLQFALIGRVFNKVGMGPVSVMGFFGDSLDGGRGNLTLYMCSAVGSKWLGLRFSKYSDSPVFNILIKAELESYEEELKSMSRN